MSVRRTEPLVVVAVHGRDQTSRYMVDNLIEPLNRDDVEWVLPDAPNQQWYSGRAGDPLEQNQKELDASLSILGKTIAPHRASNIVLVGFSQGGCLVAELLARTSQRFAAAVVLTGTLMGPNPLKRTVQTPLDGMPVVLGVGLRDPWMTTIAATDTHQVLSDAGATSALHVVDTDQHQIHAEDVAAVSSLLDQLLDQPLEKTHVQ